MRDILIIFVVTVVGYCLGLLSYYPIFRWKRWKKVHIVQPLTKKIIAVDPAKMGDDETVIYALGNEKKIDWEKRIDKQIKLP